MKTAIFYDLENIGLASKDGCFESEITNLLAKIKASGLVEDIGFQKAYIRETHAALPQIEPAVKKLGIDVVLVKPIVEDGRKKANLVDFKMCIDVIATIATKRGIGTVAVASGDNDFGFLCQQIKDMGKKLLVISRFFTTGASMMRLCDDWIDLCDQTVTPKFIVKAIRTRIPQEPLSGDFIVDFNAFLQTLEDDLLIRRYLNTFGLPFQHFQSLLSERNLKFPKFAELGFPTLSAFFEVLLNDTGFSCKNGLVKYSGVKQTASQTRLLNNLIRMPPDYTREKLLHYYDILNDLESVEELLLYLNFMKRIGMLKENTLCNKRTFRATIRKHLRNSMEKAGITLDEDALAELVKEL